MSKPRHLYFDDLDSRREIVTLLNHLHPVERLRFLSWCCTQSTLGNTALNPAPMSKTVHLARKAAKLQPTQDMHDLAGKAHVDESASQRLTLEIYLDIWNLCMSYRFDIDLALAELTRRVRGK